MPCSFDAFLHNQGFVLLDGGLATELERAGHELNDPLWSAKILLEDPAAIVAAHTRYLEAGADCVLTATYQATFEGLAARGVAGAEAKRILRSATDLAVEARDRFWAAADRGATARLRPLVAASIGPYGAFLADGSEYRGDYRIGPAALADFHGARLRLLAGSPVDMLACETLPSLVEAQVLARLVEDATDKSAWFTFTFRDARRISDGTPIDEVAAWADEAPGVYAVGVNCSPVNVAPAVVGALAAATRKPVIAYPNGGGDWDPVTKTWSEVEAGGRWGEACRGWVAAGAAAVGGCCRVGPAAIAEMRAALGGTTR